MQYGGGPINWDPSQGKPSDLRQWQRLQNQWAKEAPSPQLPLWTLDQLRAAGVRVYQPMSYEQAAADFRAASTMNPVNPTHEQYRKWEDAYEQAKLNLSHTQSPQQEQMIAEGNRNYANIQNQAAAQKAFYQQGPMTAQRVQAINNDPFYAQQFQHQAPWNAPQIRYGGGVSMGYVSPQDQAMMNRTTW